MLAAFNESSPVVTLKHVEDAIKELQWDQSPPSTSNRPIGPRHLGGEESAGDWSAETHVRSGRRPVVVNVVARVVLFQGGKTIAERRLLPGRFIIGRTSGNDLQIDSRFISRHHCQIMTSGESCVLEDLNSTNGVYIKSKRIRHHNLNDGDVITLGEYELLYVDDRAAVRAARESADTGEHEAVQTHMVSHTDEDQEEMADDETA
jgi:hypothetical protein